MRREPTYPIGGNVNWCSYYVKQYGHSSKKIEIELPYDAASLILDFYQKETKTGSHKEAFVVPCPLDH